MFSSTSPRETLRFLGNKIHCSPRDQSLSVNCYTKSLQSSSQMIATCQCNISQHCWAQHCCNVLGVVGTSLKMIKFEPITLNMSQYVATCYSRVAKHTMPHLSPSLTGYSKPSGGSIKAGLQGAWPRHWPISQWFAGVQLSKAGQRVSFTDTFT